MDKVAIAGHGVGCPMILIAETKGNEITDVQLEELAKKSQCSVSQIEVVPMEEFETRAKELGRTYTITQPHTFQLLQRYTYRIFLLNTSGLRIGLIQSRMKWHIKIRLSGGERKTRIRKLIENSYE